MVEIIVKLVDSFASVCLAPKSAFMGGSQKSHVPNSKKIKEEPDQHSALLKGITVQKQKMSPIGSPELSLIGISQCIFMPKCFLPF